jgi:transposase
MARYKRIDRDARFIPVVLEEQIVPGTFEFAVDHLVDHELDLSALDERFNNDVTGASAYDPRVMLKIVLLAYSRGMISSRQIEQACRTNVQFMALSGDSSPSYAHIAKFVRQLSGQIQPLFKQVLLICDAQGLIGKQMFAIDGVKLPSNASKERSGTHAELLHRADRLDKAAAKILARHQEQDCKGMDATLLTKAQVQRNKLEREAQRMREFVANNAPRRNAKGVELKSNATDQGSAKMATSKGVIQGYAAQAAVDSKHQIIVAADVLGSSSEQAALLRMVSLTDGLRQPNTLITADAGYHSNSNLEALKALGVEALIADNLMRERDDRFAARGKYKDKPETLVNKANTDTNKPKQFRPSDFRVDTKRNVCICPAGEALYSNGPGCTVNGRMHHKFTGAKRSCVPCQLRQQCLRTPDKTLVRQVAIFYPNQASPLKATELMKQCIDSPEGRRRYSQRFGTVEPVFANIRHNKRLNRITLRGNDKANTQWHLYCLVHNLEKLNNFSEMAR